MDSLNWEPGRGSRLLVIARETGARVASIPVGSRHCLHFINCFEENDLLNVDVLELERPIYDQYQTVPDLFTDICEGQPVRYVIDTSARELCDRRELDYRLAPDFPSVDMRQTARHYDDFWMLGISDTGRRGRKFFDQLIHANWDSTIPKDIYQALPFHYLGGEPVHIPDTEEQSAGAIICQIFDATNVESYFAVFDAGHVAAGPVARLRLESPVHLGFHATFVAAAERSNQSCRL